MYIVITDYTKIVLRHLVECPEDYAKGIYERHKEETAWSYVHLTRKLASMVKEGWISARTVEKPGAFRPAAYYSITPAGELLRQALAELSEAQA